ncbi:hypothetical protein COCOBI_04-4100 [Coccomyxa sp. Obi]|nr:hypothetical protein COCOBI_04-4100 [Coccomyxa sp. Obi]
MIINKIACTVSKWNARYLSVASTSSIANLVDDVISYVHSSVRDKDQALDVLKSALSTQFGASKGVQAARIFLTMSELERDRSNWSAAVDLAASASKAARNEEADSPENAMAAANMELAAYTSGTLAYLAQGQDFEAINLAEHALDIARASFHQKGAERHRWRALVAGTSLVGLTRHASGDVQAGLASADSAQAMADHTDKRRDSLSQHQDAAIPCALHRIAALRFAMGDYDEATALFQRAVAGAEAAQADFKVSATSPHQSPWLLGETRASAMGGLGQVAAMQKDWDKAEEILSQAVSDADAITTGNHPRAVPLLVPLGIVFARTQRVTYAEGVFRNAAKIVGLDPAKCKAPNNVHASTAACLSWRYAQLLAAMPKRETETESWQNCAQNLFQEAGEPSRSITYAFGDMHNLQGKGSSGAGAFADVIMRRMLPCV